MKGDGCTRYGIRSNKIEWNTKYTNKFEKKKN